MTKQAPTQGSLIVLRKRYKNNFTIIPNCVFQDRDLEWRTLGLLCDLVHLPDHFRLSRKWLSNRRPDGEHSTATAINRLKELGYLRVTPIRGANGRIHRWEWEVDPEPNRGGGDDPDSGFPQLGDPDVGSPDLDTPDQVSPHLVGPVLDELDEDEPDLPTPGSGKAATNTSTSTKPNTTTTTACGPIPEQVVVNENVSKSGARIGKPPESRQLHYPPQMTENDRSWIRRTLATVEQPVHQQLVDELAGALPRGVIKRSWRTWFKGMVRRAANGAFHPDLGEEVANARAREVQKASSRRAINSVSPEAASRHFAEIGAILGKTV